MTKKILFKVAFDRALSQWCLKVVFDICYVKTKSLFIDFLSPWEVSFYLLAVPIPTLLQEVIDSFLKSFSSVFWLKQNRFSQENTKIYHCGINKVLI